MLAVAAEAKRSIRMMVAAMADLGLTPHNWKAFVVKLQARSVSDGDTRSAPLMEMIT